MGIKLADLRKKTRSIAVEYEGEVLNIQYRPASVTPQTRLLVNRASDGGNTAEERAQAYADFAEGMKAIVESWDLLGDDGKPMPIVQESILMLPDVLLKAISEAVGEDMRPNGRPAAI